MKNVFLFAVLFLSSVNSTKVSAPNQAPAAAAVQAAQTASLALLPASPLAKFAEAKKPKNSVWVRLGIMAVSTAIGCLTFKYGTKLGSDHCPKAFNSVQERFSNWAGYFAAHLSGGLTANLGAQIYNTYLAGKQEAYLNHQTGRGEQTLADKLDLASRISIIGPIFSTVKDALFSSVINVMCGSALTKVPNFLGQENNKFVVSFNTFCNNHPDVTLAALLSIQTTFGQSFDRGI